MHIKIDCVSPISLQINGKHISWHHLTQLYQKSTTSSALTLLPKITWGHLHLSSYSRMRVDLAAQVNYLKQLYFYNALQSQISTLPTGTELYSSKCLCIFWRWDNYWDGEVCPQLWSILWLLQCSKFHWVFWASKARSETLSFCTRQQTEGM